MVRTMRAPCRSGAELGGVVEVRERLPLGDGDPEERAERSPALADLVDQEAIRGDVPAHLLVVPVEDVDGEGPVLEPALKHPLPESRSIIRWKLRIRGLIAAAHLGNAVRAK